MKHILSILLILILCTLSSAATLFVCGMPASSPVQVRVYDITDIAEDVAWTATGVTERSVGLSKSCYNYTATLTAGHAYQIDWRDSVTPTRTASETIYEMDSYVDAAISSRLATLEYTAPPTASAIWSAATRTLTSVPIALPAMQGSVYTATAIQSREVTIVRGDTPRITFDLGTSYTGWTAHFGVKAKPDDTAYVIAVKDAVWTSASAGEGYVDLTATETTATGKLYAELELRNGDSRLTAIKFILKITEDVIK